MKANKFNDLACPKWFGTLGTVGQLERVGHLGHAGQWDVWDTWDSWDSSVLLKDGRSFGFWPLDVFGVVGVSGLPPSLATIAYRFIPHSVVEVWRRGPSSRFGGLHRGRCRCRRESIREIARSRGSVYPFETSLPSRKLVAFPQHPLEKGATAAARSPRRPARGSSSLRCRSGIPLLVRRRSNGKTFAAIR